MVGLLGLIPNIINLITSDEKQNKTEEIIQEVANTIGVEATKEKILAHLEANPEDTIKLKDIELKAKKILLYDIQDAREMNIKMQEIGSFLAKNTSHILAICVVVMCFMLFYMILYGKLTLGEGNVGILVGGAIGFVTQILSFYFGSSEQKGAEGK